MSHSGSSAGNSGQADQAAVWLVQGLAALDDRLLKAKSEQLTVRGAGDLAFVVQNGDGVDYTVEFKTVRTGTCTCADFAKRGKSLGTCEHILRAVVVTWPERLDPYLELVRTHILQAVERHASKHGIVADSHGNGSAHQPGSDPQPSREPVRSEQQANPALGETANDPVASSAAMTVPDAMHGEQKSGDRGPALGDRDAIAQSAAEAMLDVTMRAVQDAMPDVVQRVLEELFARLMERAPELFQEALRTANRLQTPVEPRDHPAASSPA